MHDQLRQMFGYKDATQEQAKSCVALRTAFYQLASLVVASTPEGRARAVALAKLQEASWATIAAAVDGDSSVA